MLNLRIICDHPINLTNPVKEELHLYHNVTLSLIFAAKLYKIIRFSNQNVRKMSFYCILLIFVNNISKIIYF